jgi:hypothetical protein
MPGLDGRNPIPPGQYFITSNPNPRADYPDWLGVLRNDKRINDFFYEGDKRRDGIRLHIGESSYGCVTVDKHQPDGENQWERVKSRLNRTSKGRLDYKAGPHWWNPTRSLTLYGNLTVY